MQMIPSRMNGVDPCNIRYAQDRIKGLRDFILTDMACTYFLNALRFSAKSVVMI